MKRLALFKKIGFGILSLGFALTATAGCLTGNLSGSAGAWYTPLTLTISNGSGCPAMPLDGAQISFSNPNGSGAIGSVWGDYTASNLSQTGFALVNSGNKPALAAGQSASVQFGVNTNGNAFNIAAANSALTLNGASAAGGTSVPPNQVVNTPVPSGCLAGTLTLGTPANLWYTGASIAIVNRCGQDTNLNGAVISFVGNPSITSLAGPYYPFAAANAKVSNGTVSFTLNAQTTSTSAMTLANGASTTLTSLGLNLNGTATTLPGGAATGSVSVTPASSAGPTPNNGVLQVVVNPAGVTGLNSSTVSTITINSSALAQPLIINNSNWTSSSTYNYNGLGYGSYTIAVSNPTGYAGSPSPAAVTINNNNAHVVNVSYQALAPAQAGNISISLGAKPALKNVTATGVVVNVTDANNSAGNATQTVAFNQSVIFKNLPATSKDVYVVSVTPNSLSDGFTTVTPAFSANNFTLTPNATQNVNVSFTPVQIATTPVSVIVSGLPQAQALTLQLTNLQQNVVGPITLNNGTTALALPLNNTYATSVVVPVNSPVLAAAVSPSVVSTMSGSVTSTVNINVAPAPAGQLTAYWAGWQGYQYDLSNTYGSIPLTGIYLAFANYSNGAIDSSVSGYFSNIPAANSQIQPTYQNWTTYAYTHPNVKMIMSVGGASFSAMWSNLNSAAAAQTMATAIVKVLNTQYPVYAPYSSSNIQSAFAINGAAGSAGPQYGNSHLLGYVKIAGVDLDVEVADAATLKAMTPYLVNLVADIHQAVPSAVISFASFSVAADPVNACTVAGSAHCGEVLPLISAIKAAGLSSIVTYNVMAYDAGQNFVTGTAPLYQTALQNYVNAVGDPAHVVLGLDLQSQWPGFTLNCAQLQAEAAWAYSHPAITGGAFLWEVGDDSNLCKALPALQGMQAAM